MNMVYISHPYVDNKKTTKTQAARLQRELQESYPDECFINPIAAFEPVEEVDYMSMMEQRFELLQRCEEIIMVPGWEKDTKCYFEFHIADVWGKKITVL